MPDEARPTLLVPEPWNLDDHHLGGYREADVGDALAFLGLTVDHLAYAIAALRYRHRGLGVDEETEVALEAVLDRLDEERAP
ncbi:MAG: hypothetical protein H0U69_03470 [Trueperaceae bacterium]|nr:hypothetical protein [Trueperaceae bacterium]